MLRSRARKSGTQTSHFRGVSLLKQTGKWHAQINVGGKQVRFYANCGQETPLSGGGIPSNYFCYGRLLHFAYASPYGKMPLASHQESLLLSTLHGDIGDIVQLGCEKCKIVVP